MVFSVITPSRNQLDWLKLCVASVADQAVAMEHLVQDGCSTDGTVEWLKGNAAVHWRSEPDSGMYDAINRGLRRARGGILAWLNCDEQYLPGALGRVERFFHDHPDVDVVFGNVVVVDEHGEYLWHRKVGPPMLHHTWTCHLSTLSCATFFRRRLIEDRGFYFDTGYRCGGDGEWMVRLLRANVRMAALGEFTSVFTQTGQNLSRAGRAREEWRRLRATAPLWVRGLSPLWVAAHRARRWREGAYRQEPFEFEIFTRNSPSVRLPRQVRAPVFRQRW